MPSQVFFRKKLAVRRMNGKRQGALPSVPPQNNPAFPLAADKFPEGFYRGEVWAKAKNKQSGLIEERRHLVFATVDQLRHLGNIVGWYMDGTFEIIQKPFTQLYSIHGFLKGEIFFFVNVIK